MKVYRDALIVLDTQSTETTKNNKFVKLAYATEDPVMRQLCLENAQWWSWYIKRGWSRESKDPSTGLPINIGIPLNNSQWSAGLTTVSNKLRDYCELVISQGKPEWMRLAEKNGWRPPH
ncbi:hypothetical protein D3C71_1827570 [compost metagenome]